MVERVSGVLVVLCAVLLGACSDTSPPPEPLRPVRFVTARSVDAERVRTLSGIAKASVESRLSFRVPGVVLAVEVKVGDSVLPGRVLAELDPSDYRLEVEDAEAALSRARAEARSAEANLTRIRGLYENRNASQNDLDQARTAYDSALAAVESGSKKLELARNRLEYTKLRAPVAGAIAEVRVEVNENVTAGQVVVVLSSGSHPEVEVAVPESLIGRVVEGAKVTVTFDALPEREFDGTVTEVGVTATGVATTFPVTVRLNSATTEARPGMAAEVRFTFPGSGGPGRFRVPAFAVSEDAEGRFLFLVERTGEGTGRIRRVPVQTGDLTGDGVEILEGLNEGDLVVTAGVSRIQEGLEVKMP